MDIELDLSLIPPSERFEFWHDVGSLVHRPARSAYSPDKPISVQARLRPASTIVMGQMTSSYQYFERTERMIKTDHVDSLMLVLLEHGSVDWSAKGKEFNAQAGDLLLLDNHEICQSSWTAHRQLYAVLPRDLVDAHAWRGPSQRVLRSGNSCAAILTHYLKTIWASGQTENLSCTPELAHGLASLTRIYFSEAAPLMEADSSPEPIKQMIHQWISDHLHNPNLNASQICSAFHLSRSSLYELFKPEGGIRTHLQTCRLERARRILEDASCKANIGAIASQLGFTSMSSFSRSFRDHFGLTPREARRNALSAADHKSTFTQPSGNHAEQDQLAEMIAAYYRKIRHLSPKRH